MQRPPNSYEKPPANRAERRRDHALRTPDKKPKGPYTSIIVAILLSVIIGLLLAALASIIPAIKALAPAIWILSIVFVLLLVASKQTMFAAWRETERESHHVERARRRHEEKLAEADRKLANSEITFGADGEMIFGEQKKDQSSHPDEQ